MEIQSIPPNLLSLKIKIFLIYHTYIITYFIVIIYLFIIIISIIYQFFFIIIIFFYPINIWILFIYIKSQPSDNLSMAKLQSIRGSPREVDISTMRYPGSKDNKYHLVNSILTDTVFIFYVF